MLQEELARELGVRESDISKYKARGCPIDDVGKARVWIKGNIKPRAKRNPVVPDVSKIELPPPESPKPAADYSWEARLERARRMEIEIYEATKKAVDERQLAQLTTLLASYQRSLQGIAEAEATAQRARIDAGELIHRDTIRALLAELLVPIRNALDLLPMTERMRCNPQQPEIAENAPRAWKDALMLRLSQADTKF